MKLNKKIALFAVSSMMVFSVVGCGTSNGNQATQQDVNKMSIEDRVKLASENIANIDSCTSNVLVDLNMSVSFAGQEQVMNINTVSTSDVILKPNFKVKVNNTVDMGELGSQIMEMYIGQDGETYSMYMQNGSSWLKLPATNEDVEVYDAATDMSASFSGITNLKEIGKEELNGKEVTKIEGVISSENLKTIISEASAESLAMFTQLGVSEETINNIINNLQEQKVTIWIDSDNYAVKYEMDLTSIMQSIFDGVVGEVKKSNPELQDAEFKISKLFMSNEVSNINGVQDFELPAVN